MTGRWSPNCLPNGTWEVIEENGTAYHTVVRGVTRDQARAIAVLHNMRMAAAGASSADTASGYTYSVTVEYRDETGVRWTGPLDDWYTWMAHRR